MSSSAARHDCLPCVVAAKKYSGFLASETVIKQIPRLLGPGLNKAGKFPALVSHNESLEGKASFKHFVLALETHHACPELCHCTQRCMCVMWPPPREAPREAQACFEPLFYTLPTRRHAVLVSCPFYVASALCIIHNSLPACTVFAHGVKNACV